MKTPQNQSFCEKMCGFDFGNVNLNLNLNFNKELSKGRS